MLRSLLSMFNLFEEGILYSEKNNFVKLTDMINQLFNLLKSEFSVNMEDLIDNWTQQGLFKRNEGTLEVSEAVQKLIEESEQLLNQKQSKEEFIKAITNMMKNQEKVNGKNKDLKMQTRVICESEAGFQILEKKRSSIMKLGNMNGSKIEDILLKEFISEEIFENECKVVLNLIINNPHSHIVSENFNKLFVMLYKMEEFTINGVLSNFKLKNIITQTDQRYINNRIGLTNKSRKSCISRFTDLSLDNSQCFNKNQSLFKIKSGLRANDMIPNTKNVTDSTPNDQLLMSFTKKSNAYKEVDDSSEVYRFQSFPKWMISCLEILFHSNIESLIFNVLDFLYSMLNWDSVSNYSLTVTYNTILYKDPRNFAEQGLFTVILSKLFDLMEVNAYKKLANDYFISFVLENCDFVIQFIRKKLKSGTARDFRQIARLWKHPTILKSSTVRKLLGETVFDMLEYAHKEDPLIRNYFKNWLQYSEKNFVLIVNKLLIKLYQHSNMKLQNGNIVYNVMFNTRTFDKLLKLLQAVFNHGGNSFINFIRKMNISNEFEVFDTEMNTILSGLYSNESKRYYSFILKLLLTYLLAKPNVQLIQNSPNKNER